MRVLTQNIFGLFVGPNVKERVSAFAKPEVLGKYDVVCLQEAFVDGQFEMLKKAGKLAGLEYSFRFTTSGIASNGLGILSRYPILQSDFMQYLVGGLPERLHGDYYACKGLAYVQVAVPVSAVLPTSTTQSGGDAAEFGEHDVLGVSASPMIAAATHDGYPGPEGGAIPSSNGLKVQEQERYLRVNVYTTHTVAPYEPLSKVGYEHELNSGYRTSQLLQAIEFVEKTGTGAGQADHIIFCGDLNVQGHNSPEMKMLRCHFNTLCPERAMLQNDSTDEGGLVSVFKEDAATFSRENILNSKITPSNEDLPVQLDHILFSSSLLEVFNGSGEVVHTSNDAVSIPGGKKLPFSDHYGVAARFVLSKSHLGLRAGPPLAAARPGQAKNSVNGYDAKELTIAAAFLRRRGSRMLLKERPWLLFLSAVFFLVVPNILQTYTPFSADTWLYRLCWFPLQFFSALVGTLFLGAAVVQRTNDAVTFKSQAARLEDAAKMAH